MRLFLTLLGLCALASTSSMARPDDQPKQEPASATTTGQAAAPSSAAQESIGEGRRARYDERKFSKYDSGEQTILKKETSGGSAQNMLSSKNLIKAVVKLIFGNDEESTATSRQILNIMVSLLDMLKNTFGQRARASEARGLRDALDDAATAGASMLKGYVRSILAKDRQCVQRHLCQASREAVKDGREIGYLIAQFGGYAASYVLDKQKSSPFQTSYEASRKGRSGDDCSTAFQACNEA